MIPVVLVLVACRQGIGLDWDAVVYLSAAEAFAESGRLVSYSGHTLTTFAPGLPTLMGVLLRTGADVDTIGITLAVVSVVTTMIASYLVAKAVTGSAAWAWTAVALIGVSASTVRVFVMLKTEALFTALVMVTLALCLWALRVRRTPAWWFVSVATAVSLATATRYIGFTLIPMSILAVLLVWWPRSRRRALIGATLMGIAAGVGLLVVAYRNLRLGTAPLGPRTPSGLTPERVATDTLHVLGSYLVPSDDAGTVQLLGGLVVLGLLALVAVAAVRRRAIPACFTLVFVGGFLGTLLYSEFATVIQRVSERLLAPVFPSIVILIVAGSAWLFRPAVSGQQPNRTGGVRFAVTRVTAIGLLTVVIIMSVISSVTVSLRFGEKGIGYNSVASRSSPTANAARDLPAHVGLAAMNGPRVYLATRRTPIHVIPATNHFSPPGARPWRIRQITARVRSGEVDYLIYFKQDRRGGVVTPKELEGAGLDLRKIAQYRDGAIWEPVR